MHTLKNIFKGLVILGATLALGFTAYASINPPSPNSQVPAVFETYLANSEGTADTSLVLENATLYDGTTLAGRVCLTVDSNTSSLEYECGVANGTTVSGLQRGIDSVTGTTTIASLALAHRRGADVKITDYPGFVVANNELSGVQNLPVPILYNNLSDGTQEANRNNLVSWGVVQDTAFSGAGAVAATVSALGYVQIGTGAQAAASTLLGSTNATLAIPTSIATSTFNNATKGNVIPVTNSSGKIDSMFIATSTTSGGGNATASLFTNAVFATSTQIGAFPAWEIGKQYWVDTTVGTSTFSVPAGVPVVHVRLVGAGGSNSSTNSPGQWSTFGTNGYFCYGNGGNQGGTNAGRGGTAYGGNVLSIEGGQGQPGSSNTMGGSDYFGGPGVPTVSTGAPGTGQGGAASAAGGAGGYCEGYFGVAPPATTTATTSIQVFVGANLGGGGSTGAVIIDW